MGQGNKLTLTERVWMDSKLGPWDEFSQRRSNSTKQKATQVDKFITPEQRLHEIDELEDWVEILEQTIINH